MRDDDKTLENLIHEEELCEALKIRPATLAERRQRGFPVVRFHRTRRGYWRADVEAFLARELTSGSSRRDTEKES